MRGRRQYLILRGQRRRLRELTSVTDRTRAIAPGAILLFATLRNEENRLPWFLAHYRRLGVTQFLIVANNCTDGSEALLRDQPDVSLWRSTASYKASRFGMDWMNGLLARYGHGHWCLTVDADELLIYPHWETRPLPALTDWLDAQEIPALGTMMLDLYPEGPLGEMPSRPGQDPLETIPWFDSGNYTLKRQSKLGNLWIQGGPRARAFFSPAPHRAPTLGKVPLVRWHWRYAYVSSTHTLLPRHLNDRAATTGGEDISGLLLHTKFLSTIVEKSREEAIRGEHFENSSLYNGYYTALSSAPQLQTKHSMRYQGWRGLEALGLMSRGGWL
ncbi:glycosyltransferase family 2 protein [Falsigemmobacter faecalis]|uniref:Glycosyltransferase family 2 protein n=1 Tax=Falsigemmobacter faecalis TaxID=2488730 RepID=A0A3P3DWH0_9RHOB|nr:glycosyltransferase family 2 protein [Falsigemmobacter faecalis]